MSARNRLENKRLRRAERSTQKPLPAYVDLVQWVRIRSNLTAGAARRVIFSGALRVDSHVVGVKKSAHGVKYLDPILPAEMRERIQIVMPDEPS